MTTRPLVVAAVAALMTITALTPPAAAASLAAAPAELGPDFDGDGFGDLATGVPAEDLGPVEDAGVVQVLYGTASGLSADGDQVWSQDDVGGANPAGAYERFGDAVGWGDFDGDGFDDLAIGVPRDEDEPSGVVHVLRGSVTGLGTAGSQVWSQGSPGVVDEPEPSDMFGAALLGRDLDADGFDELVIGSPGEDVAAGAVHVLAGSAAGLTGTGAQRWRQLQDRREDTDAFGSALAVGDLDGDGDRDLVVGAPGEDLGRKISVGAVSVILGSPDGLQQEGNQLLFPADAGIEVRPLKYARFGGVLATGRFNGDSEADLALGLPYQKVSRRAAAGAIGVVYGSPSGLSPDGAQLWHQDSPGVVDEPDPLDYLGSSLIASDLDADGRHDLVAGAPRECGDPCVNDAGAVVALFGSTTGITGARSQLWSQESPGIEGVDEPSDHFGRALARGDFDGDGRGDVAIGVWLQRVSGIGQAGVIAVLRSGSGGLVAEGNQVWTQDSAGIGDQAEENDQLGDVLMSG